MAKAEVLTRPECLTLLGSQNLGRVGASIDALPVILPVHFALVGQAVVFRTNPGSRFDAATLGAVVAFQADRYEPESGSGWSVLVQGVATEIDDPERRRRAEWVPVTWWDDDATSRLVQIEATQLSGRQFGRARP